MRTFRFFAILGVLVATALAPTKTQAAETIRFAQDDQSARALFSSTDSTGCILTEVSVFAVDGQRNGRSEASITISQSDACAGTLLLAAEGRAALAAEAFRIDGLESAALDTAIEVFDTVSNSSLTLNVSLVWEGTGDPLRQRVHTHIMTRAFSINFRFDGTDRPAVAVGTVTDGTTNFTPEPGVDNGLAAIRAGSVTVQRN